LSSALALAARARHGPYNEVAEINVTDLANYEKSGVDKMRDGIKANGGKVVAGGYNKTTSRMGAAPPNRCPRRTMARQRCGRQNLGRIHSEMVGKWRQRYASDFRDIGVEGIEQK
jgi:hypothetical protein